MATPLQIQSFALSNLGERTALADAAEAGAGSVEVDSAQGYAAGDILYVGTLSQDGCERVVVQSVPDARTLALTAPLTLSHGLLEPVTGVRGDRIRIYRAPNVDGKVPADDAFAVLATRSIDPDQKLTWYTDSSGSSDYWYRFTYFNETTLEETAPSEPVRGDDFGHYADLGAIRREAGFENAVNLSDVDVDQKRRAAEAEINTKLGNYFTVPFKPVPDIIKTITIMLAAGLLLQNEYRGQSSLGDTKIKDARAMIATAAAGQSNLDDGTGVNAASAGISGWPVDDGDRLFRIEDEY